MMAEKGKHPVAMRPGGTPVPIPNTMVKTRAADDTMLGTAWESRRLPEQKKNKDNDGTGNFPCGRGLSSAGRAPALQAGGREFESLSLQLQIVYLHNIRKSDKEIFYKIIFGLIAQPVRAHA